jgi:predicted O-methyltransferase YrrM
MQMAWGYAPMLIIESACRHKLFDQLDAGAKTVEQLAAGAKISPRGARSIANALCGLDLMKKDAEGRYSLTPESETFLISSKPTYIGGLFHHFGMQIIPRWLKLADIVQQGHPIMAVNQEDTGSEFFEAFVEDLFPLSYAAAQALAAELKVSEVKSPVSVLDLAAGSGVWSIALAQASPLVRVTAVDWPTVLPVTRRVTKRFGVADQYTFVEGDLGLADFGSGHQVATLGHILHSEGEARSKELLAKTAAAMASGGTIAIQEFLVDQDRSKAVVGLMFSVNMLVATDQGDTFSFEEIASWLKDAGFVNARLLDSPGPSPLILANRA